MHESRGEITNDAPDDLDLFRLLLFADSASCYAAVWPILTVLAASRWLRLLFQPELTSIVLRRHLPADCFVEQSNDRSAGQAHLRFK